MLILVDFDTVLEGKGAEAVAGFTALAAKMATDEKNHIIIYTTAATINPIEAWLQNDYKVAFTEQQCSLSALNQNLADDQIVDGAIVFTGADLSYLPASNDRYTVVAATFGDLDAAIAAQPVVENKELDDDQTLPIDDSAAPKAAVTVGPDESKPVIASTAAATQPTDVTPPITPESKDTLESTASTTDDEQELAALEAAEQAAEAERQAAIQAAEAKAKEAQAKKEALRQKAAAVKAARAAQEKAELERLAAEKAEQTRLAAEKAEQDRVAAEKAEQERVAAEAAATLKTAEDELTAAQAEVTSLDQEEAHLLAELTRVRAQKDTAAERVRTAMSALRQLGSSSVIPLPEPTTPPHATPTSVATVTTVTPVTTVATGSTSIDGDTLPPVEPLPRGFLESESSPPAPKVGQAEYDAMVEALTQLDDNIDQTAAPDANAKNTQLKQAFLSANKERIQATWEDLIQYEQALSTAPAVRLFDLALSTALILPLSLTLAEIPAGSLAKFGTDQTAANLKAASLPLSIIAGVILDTATAKYPDASAAAAKAEWLQKRITNTELGQLLGTEHVLPITAEIKRLAAPSSSSSWWHFGRSADASVSASAQPPANTSGAAVAVVETKPSGWSSLFGGNKSTKPEPARTALDENFDLATGVHYDATTKKHTTMAAEQLTATKTNREEATRNLIKALILLSPTVFEPKTEATEMTPGTHDKLRRLPEQYRAHFAETAIAMAKEAAAAKHHDTSSEYHKDVKARLEASLGIKRTKDSGADKDTSHTISTETTPTFFGVILGNHRDLIMAEINLQRKLQFIAKHKHVVGSPANDGSASSGQYTAASASASGSPDTTGAPEAPKATPASFVTEQIGKFKDLINCKLGLLEAHKPGVFAKNIDDMKMEIEALQKLVSALDSMQAELAQQEATAPSAPDSAEQETLPTVLANVVTRVKEAKNERRSQRAGRDVLYSTGFEKHGAGRLLSTSKGQEYINNMLEAARALQLEIDKAKAIAQAAAATPAVATAAPSSPSPTASPSLWQ